MGDQGRFGNVSGHARDGFWTATWRPKADLGTPRASQERPGAVRNSPRGAPETLQDPTGEPSECVWCAERRRTRLGTIFRRIRLVARKLQCVKNEAPATVLDTSHEGETERMGTPKTVENRAVSPSKIVSGTVRATQNRARAAQVKRRNASEAPPGPPKLLKKTSNEPVRTPFVRLRPVLSSVSAGRL